jgi:membrane protein implicated in regulation of membrane protease activity
MDVASTSAMISTKLIPFIGHPLFFIRLLKNSSIKQEGTLMLYWCHGVSVSCSLLAWWLLAACFLASCLTPSFVVLLLALMRRRRAQHVDKAGMSRRSKNMRENQTLNKKKQEAEQISG